MARGVPKAGFRMTKKRVQIAEEVIASGKPLTTDIFVKPTYEFVEPEPVVIKEESEEDIKTRIIERFTITEEIVLATAMGVNPALVISGPPGLGKSHVVTDTIQSLGLTEVQYVKGRISPPGLYKALYATKHEGGLLVIDDSDSIFDNELSLNLLKAATDSEKKRLISWRAEHRMIDDDGNSLPDDFDYEGSIIFITNVDFYKESNSNSKLAPHLSAIISRCLYVDLGMKSKKHYMVRVKQVLFDYNMFEDELSTSQRLDMFQFMEDNINSLREISLRVCKKIAILMNTYDSTWKAKAKLLLCEG